MVVEMPMTWHEKTHAKLTGRINEPMNRRISESMKERSDESMNQTMNRSIK